MTDIAQLGIEIRVKNLEEAVRKLDDLSDRGRKAEKSVDGLGKGMSKIGGIAGRLGAAITAAFSVAAIVQASRAIYEVGSKFESIRNTLKAVTGDTALAAKEFRFVRDEAMRLGVAFDSSAQAYAKLAAASKGTSLEGSKTREIFTAVSEASRVLGLSSYESEGALNALQQMISKGTVQAEELRGQLGERIPGAFNLAAKAMGVTTKELGKMMEQGEVLAEDLLPRLAQVLRSQYAAGLEEATHTAAAEFERFGTLAKESADIIYQAFSQDLAQAVRGLNTSMASLNATLPAFLAGIRAYANDILGVFNSIGVGAEALKGVLIASFAPFRVLADNLGLLGAAKDKVVERGGEELQKGKLEKLGKEIELISQGRGTVDPLRNKTAGMTFDDLDRVLGKVNDKTAAYRKTLEKIADANKGAGTAEQKRHEANLEWVKQRQDAERILAEAQKAGDGDLEARAKEAIALADSGYKKAWETAGKAAKKAGASAEKASDRIADALREINEEIVVLQNQLSGNTYGATLAEIDADINKKMDDLRDSMKGAKVGADQLARALEGLEQERTLKKQIALIEQLGARAVKSTEEQLAELDTLREAWIAGGADRLAADVRYYQERKAIIDRAYEDEMAAGDNAADKYDAYLSKIRAAAEKGGEDRIAVEEDLLERIGILSGDIIAIKEEMYSQVVEIAKAAGLSEAQAQELVAQSMTDAKKRQLEAIRDTATSYDQWASAQKGLDDGAYMTSLQRQHEDWAAHYESLGRLSDGFTDSIVTGMGDIVRAVASGTAEWEDLWSSLMNRLLDVFLSFLEDMLRNWLKNGLGSILGKGLSGASGESGSDSWFGNIDSIAKSLGKSSSLFTGSQSSPTGGFNPTSTSGLNFLDAAKNGVGAGGGFAAAATATSTLSSVLGVVGIVGGIAGLAMSLFGGQQEEERPPEEVWRGRSYMYQGGNVGGIGFTQMDDGSYKITPLDPLEMEEERKRFKETVKDLNTSLRALDIDFTQGWEDTFSFSLPPISDELAGWAEWGMKNALTAKALGDLAEPVKVFQEGMESLDETLTRLGDAFGVVQPLVEPLGINFAKMGAASDDVILSYSALATGFNDSIATIAEAMQNGATSTEALSESLLATGEAGRRVVGYFNEFRKELTNIALANYSTLLTEAVGGEDAFKQAMTVFADYAMGDRERAEANITYYKSEFSAGTTDLQSLLPGFNASWIGENTDAFWAAYASAMSESMPPSIFDDWAKIAGAVANLEESLNNLADIEFTEWAWDEELKYRRQVADEQKYAAEITRMAIDIEQELADARNSGATYTQQAALIETQIYEMEAKLRKLQGLDVESDDLETVVGRLSASISYQIEVLQTLAADTETAADAFETFGEAIRDTIDTIKESAIDPYDKFVQARIDFGEAFETAMKDFKADAQEAMGKVPELAESLLEAAKKSLSIEEYDLLKARTLSNLYQAAERSETYGEYGGVASKLYTTESGLLARAQSELQEEEPNTAFISQAKGLFDLLTTVSDAAKDTAEGRMTSGAFATLAKGTESSLMTDSIKELLDGTLSLEDLTQDQARLMIASVDALEALEKYTGTEIDLSDKMRLELESIAAGVDNTDQWSALISAVQEGQEEYINWLKVNIEKRRDEADRLYLMEAGQALAQEKMSAYFQSISAYLVKQTHIESLAAAIKDLQSKYSSTMNTAMMAGMMVPMAGLMWMATASQYSEQIAALQQELAYWQNQQVNVPGYAAGGIVYERTLANVAESGPEAIIPLESGSVPVRISNPYASEGYEVLAKAIEAFHTETAALSRRIADNTGSTAKHTYKTAKEIERVNLTAEMSEA